MRIVIFHEGGLRDVGGTEYCDAVLASALREYGEVTLFHFNHCFSADIARKLFNEDLTNVRVVCLEPPRNWHWSERLRVLPEDGRVDAFIWHGHYVPVSAPTRRSLAYVHFPILRPFEEWPFDSKGRGIKEWARRVFYRAAWRRLVKGYGSFLANSAFTASWTRRRWNVRSDVVYPPVRGINGTKKRVRRIVAVSRFSKDKKIDVLIEAFEKFRRVASAEWEFSIVGTASCINTFNCYAEKGRRVGVKCIANVSREHLQEIVSTSTLFWHVKGLGTDVEREPEGCEHFGISVVEAMSAGCVPVAYRHGGPCEIIEDGWSGFLVDDIDALVEVSLSLERDQERLDRVAEAARRRSRCFSRERFVSEIRNRLRL